MADNTYQMEYTGYELNEALDRVMGPDATYADVSAVDATIEDVRKGVRFVGSNRELQTGILELANTSPEDFGAVGDGVADDTAAWQAAVDSGYNVTASKATYKCGQINVTKSITIDCGMATFISTGTHGNGVAYDQLFVCSGEVVETLTGEADYAAFTNNTSYSLTGTGYTDYTGYAFLRGTNYFAPPATDTFGGFAARFSNGKLCDTYPIDVTGVSVDIINPITVVIKNIADIQRSDSSTYTRPIEVVYGANCILENINVTGIRSYATLWFEKSYACRIDKCSIVNSFGSDSSDSYPVMLTNSSFCTLSNSNIYNEYWHCWSTGGANPQYLCFANIIDGCVLRSPETYAILDHENGRGTRVTNSISNSILVRGLGVIDNVTILDSDSKYAYLDVCFEPTRREAIYSINNVRFQIDPTNSVATAARIHLRGKNVAADTTYYIHDLTINQVSTSRKLVSIMTDTTAHNGTLLVETVKISQYNGSFSLQDANIDTTNLILTISDVGSQSEANAVANQCYIKGNKIFMSNCCFQVLSISSCEQCMMSNVRVINTPTTLSIGHLVGSNLFVNISNDLLNDMSRVNISSLHREVSSSTYEDVYNIRKMYSAPIGLIYQKYELVSNDWVLNTIFTPKT